MWKHSIKEQKNNQLLLNQNKNAWKKVTSYSLKESVFSKRSVFLKKSAKTLTFFMNSICRKGKNWFKVDSQKDRLGTSLFPHPEMFMNANLDFVICLISIFLVASQLTAMSTEYRECCPCQLYDILLTKYFVLASLVAGRRPQCTVTGNVLHRTYPLEYQICSSQPKQKLCWASSLLI